MALEEDERITHGAVIDCFAGEQPAPYLFVLSKWQQSLPIPSLVEYTSTSNCQTHMTRNTCAIFTNRGHTKSLDGVFCLFKIQNMCGIVQLKLVSQLDKGL